jgi:drug/metabolite transporter (DMT)-like permease
LIICTTGIFALELYQIFFFFALNNNISPGLLSIILGAQPLATVFFANEVMKPIQIFGILLGLMGVSLTVYNHLTLDGITYVGIASALLSLGSITIGTIWQKKYCSTIPLTTNLFIQYSASTILVSAICMTFGNLKVTWSFDFTLALLWITLVISVGATYLFYALLKQGKATSVTSYLYCVPPVTALMDYIVFHHILPLVSIVGMILVMSGVTMIHYQPCAQQPSQID